MEAEGQLIHDLKLGRYKIVGQPGKEESRLLGGEKLDLFIKGQWVSVRLEKVATEQNKVSWKFLNERNEPVFPEEGQRVRLVSMAQQSKK